MKIQRPNLSRAIVVAGGLLIAIGLLIFSYAWFFSTGRGNQALSYEPHVEHLSGKASVGRRKHPNGMWFKFVVLKLDSSVSIKGDSNDEFNTDEVDVKEIQLYSADESISNRLQSLNGRRVLVSGTIFHEQTAWHVRTLVMNVGTIKQLAQAETSQNRARR